MLSSFALGFKRSIRRRKILPMVAFLAPNASVFAMGKGLPLWDPGEVVKIIHGAVNPVVPTEPRDVLGLLPLFLALLIGAYALGNKPANVPSRFAYLLGNFTGHAVIISTASFVSVILGFLILVHLGAPLNGGLFRTVLMIGALFSLVAVQFLALGYLIFTLIEDKSDRLALVVFAGSALLVAIPMVAAFMFMLAYAPMGELVKDPAVIREETWRYMTFSLPFEPTLQMSGTLIERGTQKSLLNVLNLVAFSMAYLFLAAIRFSRAGRFRSP